MAHLHTRKKWNGGGRGVKQFSQSCNPASCPGPHNLHHSGGHSERDSLTVEGTESPSVWQPHPRCAAKAYRAHGCSVMAENGFGWWKKPLGCLDFSVRDLWRVRVCVCNPQRKTTLRKQAHDRLRPLCSMRRPDLAAWFVSSNSVKYFLTRGRCTASSAVMIYWYEETEIQRLRPFACQ